MFTSGYFPAYFAGSYFPHGTTTVTVRPSYFPHSEFPVNFYPDEYFPGAPLVVGPPPTSRPSYFAHSAFSLAFYPDQYFPGAPLVIGPPQPPTEPPIVIGAGGQIRPRFELQVIHALVRLVLPVPRIRIRAEYVPPTIDVAARLDIPPILLEALATASPADIRAALQVVAPWVDVAQFMVDVRQTKRKGRRPADDDELDAFYMASVAWYQDE